MQYAFLLYLDEKKSAARTAEQRHAGVLAHAPYIAMLEKNDHFRSTAALEPSRDGRTLRTERGRVVVTDGPFAETREVLGGYYVVEAENFDVACVLARQCPALTTVNAAIEIRPLRQILPPLPSSSVRRYLIAAYGRHDVEQDAALVSFAPPGSATTLRLRDDGAIALYDGAFVDAGGAAGAGTDGVGLSAIGLIPAVDVASAVAAVTPWLAGAVALEVRGVRALPPEMRV